MAELSSVSQDLGLGWGAQPHADLLFDVSGPLASIFTQRAVVILQSVASGRTLSIDEGDLSGRGIRNEHSQFVVRIRPERKVSFNNSADPLHWLSIFDGKAIGDVCYYLGYYNAIVLAIILCFYGAFNVAGQRRTLFRILHS